MKYAVRRILALIITMILVSFLAFAAFHIISGDPARAILGMNATEKQLALLRQELGLDKPFLVQYFNWLLGFFSGNLGISYSYRQPVAGLIILACILAMVVFVILLCDAERRIPVQYTQKLQGRRMMGGGQNAVIPLKVNTAGVIPVIFASSLMSFPIVISQFFTIDYTSIGGKILAALNSSNWFRPDRPVYSIGLVLYIVLIILFAYFYTSITFNPLEVANNMKKSGGFIPGIRPGRPTSDYLTRVLNYIIFLGATGLTIVAVIPIIISGLFNIGSLSFTGTSLIIIVGVILETLKAIESSMLVRNYKGFLSD